MKHILFFIFFITIALVGKAQVGKKPISSFSCADSVALNFSDNDLVLKKQDESKKEELPILIIDDEGSFFNFQNVSDSINKFLINNLIYPDSSKKAGKQGTVYASFCFDENNKMSDVKILKGLSSDIDKEVLRVFSIMPDWNWWESKPPKAQKIKLYLPIKFTLED